MINVKDFGARGDDSNFDNTPAFRAAIAALGCSPGMVYVPAGHYRVTGGFAIAHHGQHIVGKGRNARIITWDAGAGTLFTLQRAGGLVSEQDSLRGISCYSPDTTHKKIAIPVRDCSEFSLEDFAVSPIGGWTGAGSIGLQTQGRDLSRFTRLSLAADIPISIEPNCNAPNTSEDCDHFHFSDTYLMPSGTNPSVLIASGVVPTNLTFDGYNAWVLGGHGLYWNDSKSVASAQNIRISGMRHEQGTLSSGYAIYLSPHASAQFVRLENIACGVTGGGLYLRRMTTVTLANVNYAGAGVAIDCDSTCDNIDWDNCFWQSRSRVIMTGLTKAFSPVRASSGTYPEAQTATWTKSSNGTPWGTTFGVFHGAGQGSLANGASVALPLTGDQHTGAGIVTASGATQQEAAIFSIGGKGPTKVKKLSGTANTADTNASNKLCLIESANSPVIVNNLGESVHYSWHTQWT